MRLILIVGSARTPSSVFWMSSGFSTGRMRQFTVALADCGRAFSACPPESWVATQVVLKVALKRGVAESRAITAESLGFWIRRFMSSPSCPPSRLALLSK